MQSLFNKYGELNDEGIPIEDARFILPYSYHSNIIMGCDAHELIRITCDLLYGKNSNITEVKEFATKLKNKILEYAPYLSEEFKKEENKNYYKDNLSFVDKYVNNNELKGNEESIDKVTLLDYTENGDFKVLVSALQNRYDISYEEASILLYELMRVDKDIKDKLMDAIINKKDQRELECVMYKFEFPISLAVLTHLTRHRMQSLMIPDFCPLNNLNNYVMPESIKKTHEIKYKEIFENNKILVDYFKEQGVRDEDLVYFYLSGNCLNVSTTLNARTLEWISRMRTCNKAQWEIRNIVKEMVRLASNVTPLVSKSFGPSCEVLKTCPEGKDSCKKRGVVVLKKTKE